MKTNALTLVFLLQTFFSNAQAPALQWQKSYGGSENDFAFSMQQLSDGGYIVVGQTASFNGDVTGNHGDEDMWVIRLNKSGKLKWQKTLGGTADESAFAVQQTTDGGFIVAGQSSSNNGNVTNNHGNLDFWVVKLDGNGNIQWQKSLGGSNADFATSIEQTFDGGYIVAGGSSSNNGDVSGHHGNVSFLSDYWVVKLDANGNIEWNHSFGGTAGEIAYSVKQTSDGGYLIGGNSESNDGDVTGMHDEVYGDFWVIKLSKSGNLQWEKSLGGTDYDQANSIIQTSDGGYVALGFSRSNNGDITNAHGNYDVWMTKINANGDLLWQHAYGGTQEDFGYSVEQTPDGGYIINGGTASNNGDVTGLHGNEDFWVIKTDASGSLQWQSALGGSAYDEGKTIDQTSEGGYIAAGYSESNNGNVSGNHGQRDFWVVKLFSCNCIPPIAGFSSSSVTASSAKLQWDTVACVTGYKVHYRVAGTTAWTTKTVSLNKGLKNLMSLSPSTTYEWQIASQCTAAGLSNYSAIQSFSTAPLREGIINAETENFTSSDFSFFPNPITDIIHIKIQTADANAKLEVRDITGKLLIEEHIGAVTEGFNMKLNLANLPAGLYYITLKSKTILVSREVVKQ